jgi:hypothetical protein
MNTGHEVSTEGRSQQLSTGHEASKLLNWAEVRCFCTQFEIPDSGTHENAIATVLEMEYVRDACIVA